jgi:hypothetical protein
VSSQCTSSIASSVGLLRGERAQEPEQAERDGPLERLLPFGLGAQECDLERSALRRRQPLECRLGHVGEEIAERRIGQLRLALDGPAAQDAETALGGGRDAVIPERALADAELALEQQADRPRGDRAEKSVDPRELRVPTDERRVDDLRQSVPPRGSSYPAR